MIKSLNERYFVFIYRKLATNEKVLCILLFELIIYYCFISNLVIYFCFGFIIVFYFVSFDMLLCFVVNFDISMLICVYIYVSVNSIVSVLLWCFYIISCGCGTNKMYLEVNQIALTQHLSFYSITHS